MANRLWVLGAGDHEMNAIEQLLIQCGETFTYAESAPGIRVQSGNAFKALSPGTILEDGITVYAVECNFGDLYVPCIRIDHHSPGDHGFGGKPVDFLISSSLGQVIYMCVS